MELVLIAAALGLVGMGVAAFARPAWLTALVGLECPGRDGRSEVRAVYGGFGVATGALALVALVNPALRPGIAWTLAAALGGMASGRVVSLALDRGLSRFLTGALVVEASFALALAGVASGRIPALGWVG